MEKHGSSLIHAEQTLVPHALSSTRPTASASKLSLCYAEEHVAHGAQMQGLVSLSKTSADIHALSVFIN